MDEFPLMLFQCTSPHFWFLRKNFVFNSFCGFKISSCFYGKEERKKEKEKRNVGVYIWSRECLFDPNWVRRSKAWDPVLFFSYLFYMMQSLFFEVEMSDRPKLEMMFHFTSTLQVNFSWLARSTFYDCFYKNLRPF